MCLHWEIALEVLDQISLTNQGWHTQEAERRTGIYAIRASNKNRVSDDTVAQEVSQLWTEVGLLTKQFRKMNFEKVNAVGSQCNASKYYESYLKEESKYLDYNLAGLLAKG